MKVVAQLLFFVLGFFATDQGNSQPIRSPISAPYVGMGAYSNNHIDVFSFTSNQAALAKLNSAAAGLYSEKRFLLNELGFYDAAIAVPTRSGTFGLDARYYGFSDYNETQAGIAYARSLGSKMDLGIQFNYYGIRIPGYGNASSINFEMGTILHVTDNVNAGLHVYNPLRSKIGKNGEERLASLYDFGICFEPSKNFFFTVLVGKEENKPASINTAMQYNFLPSVAARLGISVTTASMYMGLGFGWRSMRVDATISYHPELGITPGLMLFLPISHKREPTDTQ
ncbi:MAG TPA: hypothetical protein VFP87_05120 [Chitinophagaceae bacterium]|nr:hypothetical protein [Chitinophagaceae bacterium]